MDNLFHLYDFFANAAKTHPAAGQLNSLYGKS